jgi:hypothetical protein
MAFLITPIIFVLVIIYVAYPLLLDAAQEQKKERTLTEEEKVIRAKDDAMGTLKDIEMDFRMGKLSDSDYQELRVQYESQVVSAFEMLDRLDGKKRGVLPADSS